MLRDCLIGSTYYKMPTTNDYVITSMGIQNLKSEQNYRMDGHCSKLNKFP